MYFQKNQVTHWIFHGMVPERIALEVLIIFLLQAGIHPFYLANDCTFPLDFCSVDWRNPLARSQIENDGVT